ncbi:MAG: hypothetical protein ACOH2V_00350 [Candidatus Saccharimonadaceae bacterium]
MKTLYGFIQGTDGGYGSLNINIDMTSVMPAVKYTFYTEGDTVVVPETAVLIANIEHTGCINPQTKRKIWYLDDGYTVRVYQIYEKRTHHGTTLTTEVWSTDGFNSNATETNFSQFGFCTPVNYLLSEIDSLAQRIKKYEEKMDLYYASLEEDKED